MERIKDILYDISDIVLSLIIVALIFTVVSFKISDAMSLDKFNLSGHSTEQKKPAAPSAANTTDPNAGATAGTATPTGTEVVTVDTGASSTDSTMAGDAKPGSSSVPAGTSITIEIKSGASGYSIAKQLKAQGLIEDVNTFIQRVEEKKAGTKLRSGSFKFTSGMSLDEVIKVLTGK